MSRTSIWVILSCLHWYKSEIPITQVPATLRCPTCHTLAEVLDRCPVTPHD